MEFNLRLLTDYCLKFGPKKLNGIKAEGTVCLLALESPKSATILQISDPPRLPADVWAGHLGIS